MSKKSVSTQWTANDFQRIPLDELLREADRIRKTYFANAVELCAIVNVKSGRCSMDCRFCAQSARHQTQTAIYPFLDKKTLLRQTRSNWNHGVHRVGWVTSGCAASLDEISQVRAAADSCNGQEKRICASLGQIDSNALTQLKESGIVRYHHNLETSERFYPGICKTQCWRDRFTTVERAKSLDLEVCSGGLFGLGESWQDRFELALALRTLEVDSVPINFLNPIPGTPLADRKPPGAEEGLRIIAMFRILLPQTTIRICGGRPTTLGFRQNELFRAGANALMTGNYLTTSGISVENDLKMIGELGLRYQS